jgi:hypothetical protein
MTKRNPTAFRLASDLTTRQQVWVSSNPLTGQGHTAAMIAGTYAEHFHEEAIAKLPTFG